MATKRKSFRVGRVRGDLRGSIWYLTYHEQGQRRRPRAGSSREEAQQLAAQINAQLTSGTPSVLSFQSISLAKLRDDWLEHHERIVHSSVATTNRYRTATDHLLKFLESSRAPRTTSQFRLEHAEQFVRYLRSIQVHPNGHPNAPVRRLRDKGICFILEICRSLYNFAIRRRNLPPYAENPLSVLNIDRLPIEDSKPIDLFTPELERCFLLACDDWQFPMFLTLMLTGMRPGELTHLIFRDDLGPDMSECLIRNRPELGWQVKTRQERAVPLHPVLGDVLKMMLRDRQAGLIFRRRRFYDSKVKPKLDGLTPLQLVEEKERRQAAREVPNVMATSRRQELAICQTIWRDVGAIRTDRVRTAFIHIAEKAKLPGFTSPKMLRHLFATTLQDANVDPLIRNELMGHSTGGNSTRQPLRMTAVYTHTRPETKRRQLEAALKDRPAVEIARQWCRGQGT